jgi:hypothetical protein
VRAPTTGPPATKVPVSPRRRPTWRRRVAIGAAALLALGGGAALAVTLAGSDDGSGGEPAPGGVEMTVEPAPRLEEPAAQARGLARWIGNHTRE